VQAVEQAGPVSCLHVGRPGCCGSGVAGYCRPWQQYQQVLVISMQPRSISSKRSPHGPRQGVQ
jgi:hypothetical protein